MKRRFPRAQVSAINNITAFDEDELFDAIGTEGPVSIAYQVPLPSYPPLTLPPCGVGVVVFGTSPWQGL